MELKKRGDGDLYLPNTVVIESPYAADTIEGLERNNKYVNACMRDCFFKGEIPFASHAIYTRPGVLNDLVSEERVLGITAGLTLVELFEKSAFYLDLGWSNGMKNYGLPGAEKAGRIIEERYLGDDWEDEHNSIVHEWLESHEKH